MPVAGPGGAIEAQPLPPARVREVATALPSHGARTTSPRLAHGRRHPRHPRRHLLPPPSPPLPVRGARPGRLVHVRPPLLRLLGQERKPPSPRCQSPRTTASKSRPTTAGLPRPPPVARSGERVRSGAMGAAQSSVTATRAHWGDAVASSARRGGRRMRERGKWQRRPHLQLCGARLVFSTGAGVNGTDGGCTRRAGGGHKGAAGERPRGVAPSGLAGRRGEDDEWI